MPRRISCKLTVNLIPPVGLGKQGDPTGVYKAIANYAIMASILAKDGRQGSRKSNFGVGSGTQVLVNLPGPCLK